MNRRWSPSYLSGNRVNRALASILSCALSFAANHASQAAEQNLFQDEKTAQRILKIFLSINGQMNDAIASLEHQTSPEEYKTFKRSVGHVIYEVFEQIVEPICKQHPSLRPPEMEA
jgi:hypothetical protein